METARSRILQFISNQSINPSIFLEKTGLKKGFIDKSHTDSGASDIFLSKILEAYPYINAEWLITGNGSMLKEPTSKKMIPLYEDVGTVGGTNMIMEDSAVYKNPYNQEFIDAGDWFPKAAAAIRHYNGSMKEYPSGCVLVLANVESQYELNWGEHYVIEYGGYRVTKELQPYDDEYVMAYSTNEETYPDGRLRYPPFKIPKSDIRRIFLVLGYVAKRYSNGFVFTNNKTV